MTAKLHGAPAPSELVRRALLPLLAVLVAGCALGPDPPPAPPTEDPEPRLEPFLDGFAQPVLLVDDPATEGALYVVEQAGRAWRVVDGTRDPQLFLDVRALVKSGGEQGLLGMAFEPEGRPRRLYVSYTDLAGESVLARYPLVEGAVDADAAEILLTVDQPYANHNGGHVLFGPDGLLYYGLGDGGSAGDPHGNGQNPRALLGSLLRLDVRPERGYAIPPDNPYADGKEGAPEVWAKGLRNPWRFSFDRATGDLWIADVGQNSLEEVDRLPAGSPGGANFGWNVYEGTRRFSLLGQAFSEPVMPVSEYGREEGCSITGGLVYHGPGAPHLEGKYLFSDYCSGRLWSLTREGDAWRRELLLDTELRVTSFGEDERGEAYVVDHGGAIVRLVS